MRKIQSLFVRNYESDRLCRDEIVPGSEWVCAGEGVATRKRDGTSCLWQDGRLWKRYDRKPSKQAQQRHRESDPWKVDDFKPAPDGWEACEDAPNEHTGHWPGWLPVGDESDSWMHREALAGDPDPVDYFGEPLAEGQTYELCGPRVGPNPEGLDAYVLIPHGGEHLPDAPRTHGELIAYLAEHRIEGIVWHHPYGKMVKAKARDFGLEWPR